MLALLLERYAVAQQDQSYSESTFVPMACVETFNYFGLAHEEVPSIPLVL